MRKATQLCYMESDIISLFYFVQGDIILKADVWDADSGLTFGHDLIEAGLHQVWDKRPASTIDKAQWETYILNGTYGKRQGSTEIIMLYYR